MMRLILLSIMIFALYRPALAANYKRTGDTAGQNQLYIVKEGDTLYDIARRFDLGIVELMTANPGADPWLPEEGRSLLLPTMHILPAVMREGIVINLAELRLYFFLSSYEVMTFPIGIGKQGWQTPTGSTSIVLKRKNPVWTPPPSIRRENPSLPDFIAPGPENPLGDYALNLSWPGYVIHGTNRPQGIGRRSSHGCIRLYPEDIKALFESIETGMPVTIIDTPYKIGWRDNDLMIEILPTQKQSDMILTGQHPGKPNIEDLYAVLRHIESQGTLIDWQTVAMATQYPSGVPVIVNLRKRLND